jgi:hypothetical protein
LGLGFVMRISVMFLWFLLRGDISHHRSIVGYIRGRCFVLLFVFSLSFFLYATSAFIRSPLARDGFLSPRDGVILILELLRSLNFPRSTPPFFARSVPSRVASTVHPSPKRRPPPDGRSPSLLSLIARVIPHVGYAHCQ